MPRFLLAFLALTPVWAYQLPAPNAAELARQIREAGLDPAECYRVRDFNFTKDDVRLYLNDGYLIFSKPVQGQRLSALFTTDVEGGDGEVIIIPPTRAERQSLASFTQSPNLDEHVSVALMVFTDGSGARLRESLLEGENAAKKSAEMGAVLAQQWTPVISNIMQPLQVRVIGDLLAARPVETGFTLLAVSGKTLGIFDVVMDARSGHHVVVRQRGDASGKLVDRNGFNVWTDFLPRAVARANPAGKPAAVIRDFTLSNYRIQAEIAPRDGGGLGVRAVTRVTVRVGPNPARSFPFEITRAMQIRAARIDGAPAEILRDDAPGARVTISRQEGEVLAVAADALAAGSEHEFEFEHQGDVITTRGDGVFFVSARGTWYPHVDTEFATYDLTFRYPRRLTLVSAGDAVEDRVEGDVRVTHRRVSVPIAAAGFNLGVYEKITGTAAGVSFEVYGNRNLEDALRPKVVLLTPAPPVPLNPRRPRDGPRLLGDQMPAVAPEPDPRGRLRAVSEDLSASLEFFTGLFGPPVMKTLTVAPIPGTFGQGFPGLVYLSTFAYIEPSERPIALRNAKENTFNSDLMVPHEVAHQWWGGVVTPGGPKDEWLMEAFSSYSALLFLEKKRGVKEMEKVLNGYRDELLSKDENGAVFEAVAPIVWGDRLPTSSNAAWRVITYNKGTWILHMLRRRMGDTAFLKLLAELRRRYAMKSVTTEDFRAMVGEFRPSSFSADAVDMYFDNWVYSTGVPAWKLQYAIKGAAPAVTLSGTITQTGVTEDFAADAPVEVQFGRGAPQIIWVRMTGESGAFSANLRQVPTRVGISDDTLMKK